MGDAPNTTGASTNPLPTHPAKPSRKTGRFGKVDSGSPVLPLSARPIHRADPDLPVPTPTMPNKGVRVARRRRLLRIAGTQQGLFTVAQANEAGLDRRARHHHLTYGNWRRTDAPCVYRLTGWPPDEHERLRAWLLWAGPGAHLTSWTALGLARLTAAGPRVPVDLEIPFRRDRAGVRRRERLRRQLDDAGAAGTVHLHPGIRGSSVTIDGLRTRAPAEAICAAVNHRRSSIALGLASTLMDSGALRSDDLLFASLEIGCGPINELLLRRFAG